MTGAAVAWGRFAREIRTAQWPRSAVELAARGVSRSMTRGAGWRRTSRGFFVPAAGGEPRSVTQRILDAAPLIPTDGALAGWAAAYVHGVDFCDGIDPETGRRERITINLGGDLGRRDTGEVHYVRERLQEGDREIRHGLRVTTPQRTAFDGARWAVDPVAAVVFLDQVGHALRVDFAELTSRCAAPARWAGVSQARAALRHADAASASPWESRLRMFYVGPAGLPRPLVNRAIFDRRGRLLGVADLFDPDAGLVTEFDGQDHRARRRHRADNLREEDLEAANLVVCRVDSLDLRSPVPLAERLRMRHDQGRRRNRAHDRWTVDEPAWWRSRRAS